MLGINWGYTLKCLAIGIGGAALALAPFVMSYLWLVGVI